MTDAEILAFYEKLYFHEIEAREKIHGRLQIPLTLIVAIAGGIAFLFQGVTIESSQWSAIRVTFSVSLLGSSIALCLAIIWFANAFYNHVYYFLPTPQQSAVYKLDLEATYKDQPDKDILVGGAFQNYLRDRYVEYGTFNAVVNDRRSAYIHRCNGAIIATVILLASAFVAFSIGGLDKTKGKNVSEVVVTKPIDVRVLDGRK